MRWTVSRQGVLCKLANLLLASSLIAACAAQPTPTPLRTPVPPTATLAPTRTPIPPTATPAPPTATPVPPTATPAPPTAVPTRTTAPAAAGTPTSPAEAPTVDFEVTRDILYANVDDRPTRLDVYAPTQQGPWPVVVAIHGAWVPRYSLNTLVKAIAAQGAVVYNADVIHGTPHMTSAIERIGCAVRFARHTAAGYGGDPNWIALVGHSAGGHGTAVIALAGDVFGGDCVVTDASTLVDALVTYEGVFDLSTHVYHSSMDFTAIKNEDPELWQALNPYSQIGRNPELRVRLVHGDAPDLDWSDTPLDVAVGFHQALAEAGYDVELTVVEGAPHQPYADAIAVVVEQLMELARSASQ